MDFSVIPSDKFKKEAKRLIKKYPSLKQELAHLAATLATDIYSCSKERHLLVQKDRLIQTMSADVDV